MRDTVRTRPHAGTGPGDRRRGHGGLLTLVVLAAMLLLAAVQTDPASAAQGSGGQELASSSPLLAAEAEDPEDADDAEDAAAGDETEDGEDGEDDEPVREPVWTALLPPLLAIGLALATRQIIPSLVAGVWLGAWLVEGVSVGGIVTALLDLIEVYVVDALSDPDHVAIIVFTLMIGGMVGIVRRNGGTDGIVERVTRFASTPRRGQLATGGLGVAIFFDDYANTLVVGNTMRPITDRLEVSREKLAYLVDSTAAPIATIALVTTWIGFQVGLIGDALADTGIELTGYAVFLRSIPYAFYPILAIVFVFAVAVTGRDFGPMRRAEQRARDGRILREGRVPQLV